MSLATRVARRYLASAQPESLSILKEFFGLLHALYWSHWTAHWQVQGTPFYGDHLLFERLYQSLPEEMDTLAEKMVTLFGPSAVDAVGHLPLTQAWIERWDTQAGLYERALWAESDFQGAVRKVYDRIKEQGEMSLGLDDFLMAIANDHETHLYLLKQRLREASKTASDSLSAEKYFFYAPRNHETREFAETGALTNSMSVAKGAIEGDQLSESARTVKKQVAESPPTISEILEYTPGSSDFSTLSRYVVETEQTKERGVPQGWDRLPKTPDTLKVANRRRAQ